MEVQFYVIYALFKKEIQLNIFQFKNVCIAHKNVKKKIKLI